MKSSGIICSMDQEMFQKQKCSAMSEIDLSRKGSVDSEIAGLVSLICRNEEMFTTSSCSGRVVLIEENDVPVDFKVKKQGCQWLHVTHTAPTFDEISAFLTNDSSSGTSKNITLKYEPFVLHAQCRTLRLAKSLCDAGLAAGFRNSGVVVGRRGRLIVAIRGTHTLQTPLVIHNCSLSTEFLTHTINRVGALFAENSRRIRRFTEKVEQLMATVSGADLSNTTHTKRDSTEYHCG